MRYVLDSCVALKWVLAESDSVAAIRLRDGYSAGIHELIAPDVFHVEAGHALTRAERSGRIVAPGGWLLWQAILADCPQLHSSLPLMPRAYQISSQMRIGIYDCLYVALAERENIQFITADSRLYSILGPAFPFLVPLASAP